MWTILEHRRAARNLARSVPQDVLKRYEKWKDIASISGPKGLRLIKGFHDEALSGQWRGFRSSRLNRQWRVIYLAHKGALQIRVEEVKPHDYSK